MLVLYDTTNAWAHIGELHAQMTANLVGHFGSATTKPVVNYTKGEMKAYDAVIYNGSTWDEPIPEAFLDDVIAETRPVIWINRNIWQLTPRVGFTDKYGWHWARFDEDDVQQVRYKGQTLKRDPNNPRGIMDYTILQPSKIKVVAEAVRPDGTTFPWAIKSGNLTYIGEMPVPLHRRDDRYLVFADMLFDLLAPSTPERHRALVRLEDVGPDADPTTFATSLTTCTAGKFRSASVCTPGTRTRTASTTAACPRRSSSPTGRASRSSTQSSTCRPTVGRCSCTATRTSDGIAANPYDGMSGDDFEFFTAHVDAEDYVRLRRPGPGDSVELGERTG